MNNVSLVGRPTKDPELRYGADGTAICFFTLAVDREFKNRDGQREADFIHVKTWNRLAEIVADYVDKGRLISVQGRIETSSYQQKDGSKKYSTAVVAENIGFLSKRRNVETSEGDAAGSPEEDGFTVVEGEQIPF